MTPALRRSSTPDVSTRHRSTVTDLRQARLLTDPRSTTFIHPFLARERSVAEAAVDVGCALTTMAYRVRVLQEAGLLMVTRTAARAGRPIRYYRSSHDFYQVPLTATGFDDHQDQARRIGTPIYRRITDAYGAALARSGSATRMIGRDDNDGIYSTDLPPHRTTGGRPLVFEDRHVDLTRDQAERLCTELDRIISNLTEEDGPASRRHSYAVMVAAVPLESH